MGPRLCMAKIFYVYDEATAVFTGETVYLNIPNIQVTSTEWQTELRNIFGVSSGSSHIMTDDEISVCASYMNQGEAITFVPAGFVYNGVTYTIQGGAGEGAIVSAFRSITNIGTVNNGSYYRLCANTEYPNLNYLRVHGTPATYGFILDRIYKSSIQSSSSLIIGIKPRIINDALYAVTAGFVAISTNNRLVSVNVYRNSGNVNWNIESESVTNAFLAVYTAAEDAPTPGGDDPYNPGGTSDTGGGGGDFGVNRFGDGIDDETISQPDYDALDQLERSVLGSNFVSIYNPTRANVQALKNYLWSSQIGDTLKKLYNNPMDSIISLHMVPVTPTTSTGTIHIGGTDTEVDGRPVTNQYVTVNCGSLTIGEYWAAYLDYNPYTKLYLYLPFCGMHSVDTDEFMGQTLSIRYDVDVVTGDCLCSISGSRAGGMSTILYQYAGNCSVEIPVSAANYNARISAGLGLVGSAVGIAAAAATGGMTAPLAATAVASTAANVLSGKTRVERSGALAGSAAWMGPLKPYLILVQPTQCLPDGQASFTGYPSYITAAVGDLTGYTEFAEIHLEGIAATDAEKAEIEQILRTGVIL